MDKNLAGSSPYKATLTREQFLFHEMRTTARLKSEGLTDAEIVEKIMADNLFQYPTEKSVKRMAQNCITRLNAMGADTLVKAIAEQPADVSKQICLYAMMKNSRLVWDFMVTVIGEKYRTQDLSFGRKDLNVFFIQLQEHRREDQIGHQWRSGREWVSGQSACRPFEPCLAEQCVGEWHSSQS